MFLHSVLIPRTLPVSTRLSLVVRHVTSSFLVLLSEGPLRRNGQVAVQRPRTISQPCLASNTTTILTGLMTDSFSMMDSATQQFDLHSSEPRSKWESRTHHSPFRDESQCSAVAVRVGCALCCYTCDTRRPMYSCVTYIES